MIRSFDGKTPRIAASAFVSEAAYVIGDVEIGEHSSVWPGAVIRGDFGRIRIGAGTAVEDNCVLHGGSPKDLHQELVIGDGVQIGHGAAVNGKRIGNHVLIGMNATVLHDAEIGNFCIIGAACLVSQGMRVPDNSFVAGVPGQISGEVTEAQRYWFEQAPKGYAALAERYRREGR